MPAFARTATSAANPKPILCLCTIRMARIGRSLFRRPRGRILSSQGFSSRSNGPPGTRYGCLRPGPCRDHRDRALHQQRDVFERRDSPSTTMKYAPQKQSIRLSSKSSARKRRSHRWKSVPKILRHCRWPVRRGFPLRIRQHNFLARCVDASAHGDGSQGDCRSEVWRERRRF